MGAAAAEAALQRCIATTQYEREVRGARCTVRRRLWDGSKVFKTSAYSRASCKASGAGAGDARVGSGH